MSSLSLTKDKTLREVFPYTTLESCDTDSQCSVDSSCDASIEEICYPYNLSCENYYSPSYLAHITPTPEEDEEEPKRAKQERIREYGPPARIVQVHGKGIMLM